MITDAVRSANDITEDLDRSQGHPDVFIDLFTAFETWHHALLKLKLIYVSMLRNNLA